MEGGRKKNIVKECRRNKDRENERKGGRKWRGEERKSGSRREQEGRRRVRG